MAAPAAEREQDVSPSATSPGLKIPEAKTPSPSSSQLNLEEDEEAPLLPHERIDPPRASSSPSPSPSDAEMRRSTSAPAELSSSRSSSSSSSSGLADAIRGTLTRATARRLQRRSTTKVKSADERSQTVPPPSPSPSQPQPQPPRPSNEDLIREAQAALNLGPRDPALTTIVSAMLSAPQPTTTTTNTSAGGVSTRDFAAVQQLSSLSTNEVDQDDETSEQHSSALDADMSSNINAPSPEPAQQRANNNDDNVVYHPRHVVYMRPIKTIGPFGMWLHDFKRWQCCHCGCKTHYENHVCSNLSCMHHRCYEHCCTCLPAEG